MKFSLYTFGSGAKTYIEQVDHARRFGCTAVEPLVNLDFADLNIETAKRVREYMDAVDMKIPCFSVFIQFQKDPKVGIKKIIDMGKALGYNGWYSPEYDAPEAFDTYYPRSMKNFAAMHEQVFGTGGR